MEILQLPLSRRYCLVNIQQLNCIKAEVTLRPTVSQPVYLGVKHQSGAYDQIFITVRELQVCSCGALSLTENGSAVYNCCWSSPAQSFLGPSPEGLVTIFYSLIFETPPT
jgi:hypothetical protein